MKTQSFTNSSSTSATCIAMYKRSCRPNELSETSRAPRGLQTREARAPHVLFLAFRAGSRRPQESEIPRRLQIREGRAPYVLAFTRDPADPKNRSEFTERGLQIRARTSAACIVGIYKRSRRPQESGIPRPPRRLQI